jgi:hypothetical protein
MMNRALVPLFFLWALCTSGLAIADESAYPGTYSRHLLTGEELLSLCSQPEKDASGTPNTAYVACEAYVTGFLNAMTLYQVLYRLNSDVCIPPHSGSTKLFVAMIRNYIETNEVAKWAPASGSVYNGLATHYRCPK